MVALPILTAYRAYKEPPEIDSNRVLLTLRPNWNGQFGPAAPFCHNIKRGLVVIHACHFPILAQKYI